MKKFSKLILYAQVVIICSCNSNSEKKFNHQLTVPLFDLEQVDPDVIYISHPALNGRPPTLIKMLKGKDTEFDSIVFIEQNRFQSGVIMTSTSRCFEFNMKFSSFPVINKNDMLINEDKRKFISEYAYFFIVPGCENVQLLDSSTIHTESGKKALTWLKKNIAPISIHERINIWRLEYGKEPSDSLINSYRDRSYKLDEHIDLNPKFWQNR